jgi:aspartate-semialdehyde dehydrogenase
VEPDQGHLRERQEPTPSKFTKQIAFNVIPQIDVFMEDGATKEEWKMVVETKKILDPKIKLHATCVRVPVFRRAFRSDLRGVEDELDEREGSARPAARGARPHAGR